MKTETKSNNERAIGPYAFISSNDMLRAADICAAAARDPLNRGEIAAILLGASRILANTSMRPSVPNTNMQPRGRMAAETWTLKEELRLATIGRCTCSGCGRTVNNAWRDSDGHHCLTCLANQRDEARNASSPNHAYQPRPLG